MFNKKHLNFILLFAFVIVGIMMFRSFSLVFIPILVLLYIALARMNAHSSGDEDSADWWKTGEGKKKWDIE